MLCCPSHRLPWPVAAATCCRMVPCSSEQSVTGQRWCTGCGVRNNKAACTSPHCKQRKTPRPKQQCRGPCPHPHDPHRPFTPETHTGQETWKMLSLRRGRDGVGRMADSGQPTKMCAHGARGLTLARNSHVHIPLASAHAPEASLPRGYGSLHVISKHSDHLGTGLLQTACLGPDCATTPSLQCTHWHHSLRCHLTPPGMPWVHPVGTHPRKSHLILHCTFVEKGVHVRSAPALRVSPLGVGCGACWLELVSMVVFECLGQRQRTPRVQPYPPPPTSPTATLCVANAFSNKCQVEG
jgi:hypothetical protein